MRIAYFVSAFPSLSETFVLNQITGLIDRGHEVHVYARQRGEAIHHPDIKRYGLLEKTFYWPNMPDGYLSRALKAAGLCLVNAPRGLGTVRRALTKRWLGRVVTSFEALYGAIPLLRSGPYDVAHGQFGPNGIHVAAMREIGAISSRVVATFHAYGLTTYLEKWGPGVYTHLFNTADLIIATSEQFRQRIIDIGGPAERIIVHRLGVDCDRFTPHAERASDGGPTRIFSIGRLVEKKGFEYSIRAVGEMKRRGLACDYEIAGDGPLRGRLQALVEELGLGDCVRLLGPKTQAEIPDLFRKADIFAAPSVVAANGDEECIPTTVMEGMASGLPILSTYHASIPELVEDGVTGYLLPERDVDGLADRLADLITNRDRHREMGHAAREVALRRSNIEILNDRLAEKLQQLVAGATPAR